MKCKSVSSTIDLNVLVLYGTIQSLMENGTYSKEIREKVNKLLNYLYFVLYPYEKDNASDLISLKYRCNATYKD